MSNKDIIEIIHATTQLQNLEDSLELEVSQLIRKTLEKSNLDFIGGNDLDILIDTNIDIESIVTKALIQRKKYA
jgi:hypothetical protein